MKTKSDDTRFACKFGAIIKPLHALAVLLALVAPIAARAQSVLPLAPQPADMPPPGVFTVTTIGYQALPPNDHYSSSALVTGAGETFGYTAGLLYFYNAATPQDLTVNFANPIQLQFGDSPATVFAVDNTSGAYVGQSGRGMGYIVRPGVSFQPDTAYQMISGFPPNSFLGGYSSVLTGADQGRAVGTASLTVHTQIPLNGGDGTVASGPTLYYQFPILGLSQPINISNLTEGIFTRVRGFRGDEIVGDLTTNINYNPADSSPDVWNASSRAWVMNYSSPNSGRTLAGIPSMAITTDGFRQGGWVGLNDGTGNYHAMLWSGFAGTGVDMNPPGYFDSRVTGMSSEFQVGDGWLGGLANTPGATRHALLWHGTMDSVMDLNSLLPPGILGAEIDGADPDGNIVGSYTISLQCPTCSFPVPQQIGFIMTPNPSAALASLSFDSSNPAPGASVMGTVKLGAPAAAGGVPVTFTSSDATLVPPPPSLVIPEGQISASFAVPLDPSVLTTFMTGPAPVTLTAHTAYTSRSAPLTVTPATPASFIISLALAPAVAAPGQTVFGVVTLSQAAPAGGVVVNFNSSNPALLPTPFSFMIPAGAASASFSCIPNDNNALFYGPMPVVVQAETGSVIQQTNLTIARVPKPGTVSLGTPQNSFTSTMGGTSGVGFLYLSAVTPVSGTIFLGNSNPALSFPASIPVSAGSFAVAIPWSALPVATLTTGIVTATFNAFTSSNTVSVTASPSPSLQSFNIPVTSPTQTFSSGDTLTGTITLSGPAFLGGMSGFLVSDTPTVVQVPASVTVPTAATSASFTVTAGPVAGPSTATITATLPGFAPLSVTVTVIPGPALAITSYSLSPYTMIGPGVVTIGTVTLNQPAPAGGITLSLSASNPQPAKFPATVAVAQGQTAASFSVQGNSVSGVTATSLSASYKGVLAPLGTSASTGLTVEPTDTLHVTKCTWSKSTLVLTVTATSTNPQAIISALNANGNVPLGTMTNAGNGNYTYQMTIASISSVNIKSNFGGASGQGVTVIQ